MKKFNGLAFCLMMVVSLMGCKKEDEKEEEQGMIQTIEI